jgi:stage III sporulation protein AA
MVTVKKTPFEQAVAYLVGLRELSELPRHVTDEVCEIRLRAGQPVTLELCGGKRIRLNRNVSPATINECIREFCGQSVHSHERQFKEGWLTLCGGHRAGFTGTAVLRDGKVENLRDVSSVNLRIAREHSGSADELYEKLPETASLLIIGKPLSAKTTVLRDLCRIISTKSKIALVDERGEIAAVHAGIPSLDVGANTDVLNGFPKDSGIMSALRNLSPEYIFCDEIAWEYDELAQVANSGVKLVLTAHAGSLHEAVNSPRIAKILDSKHITHIALLGHGKNIGKLEVFTHVEQLDFYTCSGDCRNHGGSGSGGVFLRTA